MVAPGWADGGGWRDGKARHEVGGEEHLKKSRSNQESDRKSHQREIETVATSPPGRSGPSFFTGIHCFFPL